MTITQPDNLDSILEEFQKRAQDARPPSKGRWALWVTGLVVGIALIVSVVTLVVSTRIDSSQSQTPAQYQTLHQELEHLQTLANQSINKQSAEYYQLQATYLSVESQIQQLCQSVPGCVWHPIALSP